MRGFFNHLKGDHHMNAIFTNTGTVPVPIGSSQGKGWVNALDPSVPYPISGAEQTVITVGDSPTLRDGLAEFFDDLAELLRKLLTFWRDRHDAQKNGDGDLMVSLRIQNNGTNPLRVILGDPTNDTHVDAGATSDFAAPLYIEVRELGV
jgi:hypothetical protein